MIDVDKAFELFDSHISPIEPERISVLGALGRVAAADVAASVDLPPFAQSAMDGYAVSAEDLRGGVELKLVGEVPAGKTGTLPRVGSGQAVRAFTGGRIPPGADAVVRQEWVERSGDTIKVDREVDAGNDIRAVGEELESGTSLVEAGTRLDERHLGALSMTGHAEVEVRRTPAITLLISGDEVVEPGIELREGEVYDANLPFLVGWLRARGYDNLEVRRLDDTQTAVQRSLKRALDQSDLVVSTGGVSVGDYDFFTDAAEELALETVFWKLRQKPGKPLLFAKRGRTPFLGIPGNPGAVFVAAYVYLRRVLDLLEGADAPGAPMRRGVLAEDVGRGGSRLKWTGCTLAYDDQGRAQLTPVGGHRMSQLYRADAIARIDAGEGAARAGSVVQWLQI